MRIEFKDRTLTKDRLQTDIRSFFFISRLQLFNELSKTPNYESLCKTRCKVFQKYRVTNQRNASFDEPYPFLLSKKSVFRVCKHSSRNFRVVLNFIIVHKVWGNFGNSQNSKIRRLVLTVPKSRVVQTNGNTQGGVSLSRMFHRGSYQRWNEWCPINFAD